MCSIGRTPRAVTARSGLKITAPSHMLLLPHTRIDHNHRHVGAQDAWRRPSWCNFEPSAYVCHIAAPPCWAHLTAVSCGRPPVPAPGQTALMSHSLNHTHGSDTSPTDRREICRSMDCPGTHQRRPTHTRCIIYNKHDTWWTDLRSQAWRWRSRRRPQRGGCPVVTYAQGHAHRREADVLRRLGGHAACGWGAGVRCMGSVVKGPWRDQSHATAAVWKRGASEGELAQQVCVAHTHTTKP
jgi:hypothetical protein